MKYNRIVNYDSPNSLAFKFREKRADRIKSLITECYNEYGEVRIIDIGGSETYWKIIPTAFLIGNNVHITLVNLQSSGTIKNEKIFTFCQGDGCYLSGFKDHSFHIAHSNSVIEHVGNWDKKVAFAKEIQRVSKKHYLQTPNFWFPVEPHFMFPFFHWLPKSLRIKLILCFDLGAFKKAKTYEEAKLIVESCDMLSKKELSSLFPDSLLYKEHVLFFTKSMMVINKK